VISTRCLQLASLCALLLGASACQQIIGLKERPGGDSGAAADSGTAVSPECTTYCSDVTTNCKDDLEAFKSPGDCLAVCAHLPVGEASAPTTSGDTVRCRAHYAKEAGGIEHDAMSCPAAAPGGGSPDAGTPNCGTNCEGYCGLYDEICETQTTCLERCRLLPDRGAYSSSMDFAEGGDTVQCRLAHLTAAATYKQLADEATTADDRQAQSAAQTLHCGHSRLMPPLDGQSKFCDLAPGTDPNCTDYCRLIMGSCKDHPVYDNDAQCMAVCAKGFPISTPIPANTADSTNDTLACRRWHAYFAFGGDPTTHCAHAGPGGDGHCGGMVCPVYCSMLERACDASFKTAFPKGMSACTEACAQLKGVNDTQMDIGYDLGSEAVRGDTYQCRLHHLAKAFVSDDECNQALPATPCTY
jgi:hypothetical protein